MFDLSLIPVSLYIHVPWCVRKCPYCDFNSHEVKNGIPEQEYLDKLCQDFDQKAHLLQDRQIHSIFIGGGTPSLMSGNFYQKLFDHLRKKAPLRENIEITLEANPGTTEQKRFKQYRQAGINRISLGIQSLHKQSLKNLGRIHDENEAKDAIKYAQDVFDNINCDMMYALPQQSLSQALEDLEELIEFKPNHISWYQLTLEPNTLFHKHPPKVPDHDDIWEIQEAGQRLLAKNGFEQYEVSAYAQDKQQCEHNLNYWRFGDYIGIGAGAHGKITDKKTQTIIRHHNLKHPNQFLKMDAKEIANYKTISDTEIPFEFMLNVLRLNETSSKTNYENLTGKNWNEIHNKLLNGKANGLLQLTSEGDEVQLTEFGRRFLNDAVSLFI